MSTDAGGTPILYSAAFSVFLTVFTSDLIMQTVPYRGTGTVDHQTMLLYKTSNDGIFLDNEPRF